jgi:hypothetical protein
MPRLLLALAPLALAIGCAATDPPEEEREFHEKLPPPPMWRGPHPVGGVYGAVSDGTVSYKTTGTASNVRDRTNARLYRLAYLGPSATGPTPGSTGSPISVARASCSTG